MIWTGYKTPHPVTFELNVIGHLKVGIVESEETSVARHQLGKHVNTATNMLATTEKLLDVLRGLFLIKYSKCSERKVGSFSFPGLLVHNANA
jgi:hypothetical protein